MKQTNRKPYSPKKLYKNSSLLLTRLWELPSIAPEYLDKAWPAVQYRSSRWPSFAFQGPTSRARPKLQVLGTLSDVSLECTIGR
jgi:hypothetical protein